MKSKLLVSNKSDELIIFMSGWGCDEFEFEALTSSKDMVLFYDYASLNMDFDFTPYKKFYLISFSAGVFATALVKDLLPELSLSVAVNGSVHLFDEKYGLDKETVKVLKSVDETNYMQFRRDYLCYCDEELKIFNSHSCRRTAISCNEELDALKSYYDKHSDADFSFDKVLLSDSDRIFKPDCLREFYLSEKRTEVYQLEKANHNIFSVHLTDFDDLLNPKADIYLNRLN